MIRRTDLTTAVAAAIAVMLTAGVGRGQEASLMTTTETDDSISDSTGGILRAQIARYPRMEIADLYKLIHQSVFGSEHAVSDPEAARGWLTAEIARMNAPDALPSEPGAPLDPAIDPISAGGEVARVHLRPFLARGGSAEALLAAFVETANEHHGSAGEFGAAWAIAESLAASGALPFSPDSVRAFGVALAAQGFPAVHHSEAYRRAYAPAYRVVRVALLKR